VYRSDHIFIDDRRISITLQLSTDLRKPPK